jgi:shikimate dehydrogenase
VAGGQPAVGGGPRRAAVLGSPVRHSLSPVLHAAAYRELGLDWTYTAHEVDEAGLAGFVRGLDGSWAGLSLTMPLKRAAIPLCDGIGELARAVHAVNTLTFADGRVRGDNTDVPGLVGALRDAGVGQVPAASVLGGGATAASALAALARVCDGTVRAYVRGPARAQEARDLAGRIGMPVETRDWADAAAALTAPLVVATTPAGAADHLAAAVPDAPGVLFDVVYSPWPTPLAAAWAARGGQVVSGLELLVHQAALQVVLMTGPYLEGAEVDPADLVPAMRAAGEAALAARA